MTTMAPKSDGSGSAAEFRPVRLTAALEEARVTPGGRVDVALSLRNASSIVDRYRVAVDGIADTWYELDKQNIPLFPGAEERITLTISPPAGTGTAAGDYLVTVRAVSEDDPTIEGAAEVTLAVDAVGVLTMDLLPPLCEGRAGTFRVTVANASNAAATLVLDMRDDQEGLRFTSTPEGPLVAPAGGESVVTVSVVPLVRETIGEPHPYQIEFRGIRPGAGGAAATPDPMLLRQAVFTFVPRYTALSLPRWVRRLPTWALRALALLLLLLLLGSGAALGQLAGRTSPSHAATPKPAGVPAGRLPQVKQLALQVGSRGELQAHWAVAGTTDVRINGHPVAPSGHQPQRLDKIVTLVLVAGAPAAPSHRYYGSCRSLSWSPCPRPRYACP